MSRDTLRGTLLMLSANIAFCTMACLVRLLADLDACMTTLFRFITGAAIIGFLAMSGHMKLEFVNNRGLFVRGILGGISTAIFFISIRQIGLVKAGFISCLYPVFSAIFAHFILKEHLDLRKGIAVTGALLGAAILLTSGNSVHGQIVSPYDALALTGAIIAGFTVVSIKQLQSTDSTIAIFFAQCIVGAGIVFVPAAIGEFHISPYALLILLGIGILAMIGQILATDSYRYIPVANASVLVMTAPVINAAAGIIIFGESLTHATIVGALIIILSTFVVVLGKR